MSFIYNCICKLFFISESKFRLALENMHRIVSISLVNKIKVVIDYTQVMYVAGAGGAAVKSLHMPGLNKVSKAKIHDV